MEEIVTVPINHMRKYKKYNGKIIFFPLEGADHTEGVLSHSQIYEDNLPKFFKTNL